MQEPPEKISLLWASQDGSLEGCPLRRQWDPQLCYIFSGRCDSSLDFHNEISLRIYLQYDPTFEALSNWSGTILNTRQSFRGNCIVRVFRKLI